MSRTTTRIVFAIACAGVGCTRVTALELPGEAAGAASALFVFGDPSAAPLAVAIDLRATERVPVSIDANTAVYAFLYADATLEELRLPAGPIFAPAESAPSRPVPPTSLAFALARDPFRWVSTGETLAEHRFPGSSATECDANGGCVRFAGGDEHCETPCTAPHPLSLIASPDPPANVSFLPCPLGWHPYDVRGGAIACEPPMRVPCGSGEIQHLAGSACVMFGSACPRGDFAEGLPADAIHVQAPMRGRCVPDADPFCTIAAAIAAAPDGATIALAKGTFRETVELTKNVTLRGACANETRIATSTIAPAGPLFTVSASVAISELTIDPGIEVGANATLAATRVRVREGAIIRGTLRARELIVEDTAAPISIAENATAIFDDVVMPAIAVDRAHAVELRDAAVSSVTASGPTGSFLIERASLAGIETLGADLVIRDAVIRGAVEDGVRAHDAHVEGTRLLIERNGDYGFDGRRMTATLTDVVSIDNVGPGIGFGMSGSSAVRRAYVEGNHAFGIIADENDPRFELELTDVFVRYTGKRGDDEGAGVVVRGSGSLAMTRAQVDESGAKAIELYLGGVSHLDDVSIHGAHFSGLLLACNTTFTPACTSDAPRAIVRRIAIDQVQGDGIYAETAELEIEDALVSNAITGVRAYSDENIFGTITLERFFLRDNEPAGIYIAPDGRVILHHGEIAGSDQAVEIVPVDFDVTLLEDDVVYRNNGTNR